MSDQSSGQLLDEAELRAALQPLRPDRSRFASGIQQRLAQADVVPLTVEDNRDAKIASSEWLQTAAAVIPISLIGKSSAGGLVKLGQLTLGKKLLAVAALPATALLLMITASIWAIIKIRRAHSGQPDGNFDALKTNQVLAGWWRRFGLVTTGMCGVLLLLMHTGYTLPVFVVFLISGIAMVSLITRLGKEHLIERATIAGALSSGLILLAQITQISVLFSNGTPFLDQMLIPAVLMFGGFLIACLGLVAREKSHGTIGAQALASSFFLLLVAWFSSSIWNPVTQRELKRYVESFDHAKYSSVSWEKWKVSAQWLRDSGVPLNWSKPHALLQAEVVQAQPNRTILRIAAETGLLQPADLDQLRDLDQEKRRLFDPYNQGKPFIEVETNTSFLMHAMVMRGDLTEGERDILGDRLAATMTDLLTKPYRNILRDQLNITKLAQLIDRPLDIDAHRASIHAALVRNQVVKHGFAHAPGGFNAFEGHGRKHSDARTTDDAIQLMQIYGVPSEVRIDALRSYLRPSWHDQSSGLREEAYTRFASLQRLESLPEVEPLTWWDYFRYEQNLMMALLFTCVCVFATLGAPPQSRRPNTA